MLYWIFNVCSYSCLQWFILKGWCVCCVLPLSVSHVPPALPSAQQSAWHGVFTVGQSLIKCWSMPQLKHVLPHPGTDNPFPLPLPLPSSLASASALLILEARALEHGQCGGLQVSISSFSFLSVLPRLLAQPHPLQKLLVRYSDTGSSSCCLHMLIFGISMRTGKDAR